MSVFSVDPDHLTTTAPQFEAAAATLSGALDRLASTLLELGACWGGDEQGAAFAEQYEPHVATLTGATRNVSLGLSAIADGVHAMGANHATTDAGVRSGLRLK